MSTQAADPLVLTNAKSADASQPQPVGAEIPVLIQGSRPAGPNQRPQPFVEESRTVIVFPRGAILRISGIVSAGQLLILKNSKTNAEIACRVVRANEKMKGYYEVDFTQPEPGFWGVDFNAGPKLVESPAQDSSPLAAPTPEAATQADLAASTEELMEDLDRALASAFASLPKGAPKAGEPAKAAEIPTPRVTPPASSIPANTMAIADSVGANARVATAPPRSSPAPDLKKKATPAAEVAAMADYVATDSSAKQPVAAQPKFDVHAAAAPAKQNWMWLVGGVAAAAVLLAIGTWTYRSFFRPKASDLLPPVTAAASNTTQSTEPANTGAPAGANLSAQPLSQTQPGSGADPSGAHDKTGTHAAALTQDDTATPAVTATASRRSAILDSKIKAPQSPANASNKLNADPSSLSLQMPSQAPVQAANLGSLIPGTALPAPPPEAAPSRVSNIVQARLVTSVPPVYPQMAAAQGLQGDVKLDLTVNEQGKVTDAKVLSGPSLLRQAATDAARQWRYAPAKLDGSVIATHVNVVVHFELKR